MNEKSDGQNVQYNGDYTFDIREEYYLLILGGKNEFSRICGEICLQIR